MRLYRGDLELPKTKGWKWNLVKSEQIFYNQKVGNINFSFWPPLVNNLVDSFKIRSFPTSNWTIMSFSYIHTSHWQTAANIWAGDVLTRYKNGSNVLKREKYFFGVLKTKRKIFFINEEEGQTLNGKFHNIF